MAISINLDEVEFYKEDYVDTGKIYLTGSITGLDSSKQYCVWHQCDQCTTWEYVHRGSLDYFFISNTSSVSLGSITHIHTNNVVWAPGEDYSIVGIYIDEVDGNCETIINPIVGYTNILVYKTSETPPEEKGRIYCSSFPTGASIYLNDVYTGEATNVVVRDLEPGYYDVKFTLADYEDYIKENVLVEAGIEAFVSKNLVLIDLCEGVVCENVCTDEGHLVIRECNPDLGICESVRTELNSPECPQPGVPTLTTSITSPEPYIAGSNIGIETVLRTSTGVPIYGEDVFFYTPTEFLGANLTNSDGKVTISFLTLNEPATYEIYTTHLTDEDIFVESNHVIFTTEEPVIPLCIQKLRLLDQDGNIIPGKFSSTEFGEVFTNGEFEFNVEENKTIEVTAYWYNLSSTKTITTCTPEPIDFGFNTEIPEIGEIGTITYDIIKQVGNDEITFYIPVTNHTDEEQCFYINLMNPDDETKVLEKAPNVPLIGRIADRIPAGDTEIIELSSTWDVRWSINNVLGKTVKFELRHSEPILDALGVVICNPLKSAYDIVHEVSIDLTNIDIIVSVCADNTEGLVTKNLQIGLMYSDPTTLTKTDVCNSPMNVIDTVSEEICTSWSRPGPFTCSGAAYLADSMFVAYARGFDDEDNEYVVTSPIFRSIYGTKHITIKVTGEPIEECFIDHPTDPTKCLITMEQWKAIKWGGIIVGGLYIANVVSPFVKGAGEGLKAISAKKNK